MALREFVGGAAQTRLDGAITSSALTFLVTNGAGHPTGGTATFVMVIDRNTASEEKILCSSRTGNTFTVNASGRGFDGTTGVSHADQATVEHVISAEVMTELSGHVNTTTNDHHTQYIRTDGTRAFSALSAIAGTPGSIEPDDAAAAGTALTLARSDHKHGVVAATPGASAIADVAAEGVATSFARSDHRHGREAVQEITHTFTIPGDVAVAVGEVDFIVPFFVAVATGRTVTLTRARHRINAGTSATVKLTRNGTDITGFTAISVTPTSTTTDPTDIALADLDLIALVVSAVSGGPKNLTFSLVIKHS